MALLVGIDLGRKSAHDVVLLRRESAEQLGRAFRFTSTCEGLDLLFEKITAQKQEGESVDFVIDSPGKAWIPIAAVLKQRGFAVYRPSADRVRKLRQAGHRKNKSNQIDALTLARCLLLYPKDTYEVFLPQKEQAQLDQLVRQRDRVVDTKRRKPFLEAARHVSGGFDPCARQSFFDDFVKIPLEEHGLPRFRKTGELFDRILDAMHLFVDPLHDSCVVEPRRESIREHAECGGNARERALDLVRKARGGPSEHIARAFVHNLVSRFLKVKLLHFVAEGVATDIEKLGGAGLVASGPG